jgi:uncharacterized membrane protein
MPSPMQPSETIVVPPGVDASRWIAVSCLLGLIVLALAWELWLPPRPSLWVVKVIPLCIPFIGLLKRRMYTYRWVSLLVWPYFIEGVVRAADRGPDMALGLLEVLLTLILFAACVMHVRLRLRKARP